MVITRQLQQILSRTPLCLGAYRTDLTVGPRCGVSAIPRGTTMNAQTLTINRTVAFLSIIVMAFGLAACSGDDGASGTDGNDGLFELYRVRTLHSECCGIHEPGASGHKLNSALPAQLGQAARHFSNDFVLPVA